MNYMVGRLEDSMAAHYANMNYMLEKLEGNIGSFDLMRKLF